MGPEEKDYQVIEEQMRAQVPALPPGLRDRTLRRCQREQYTVISQRRVVRWRLAGALAGIFIMQWLAVALLDNQRTALLTPGNPPDPATAMLVASHSPSSAGAIRNTIQSRSHMLALLLDTPENRTPESNMARPQEEAAHDTRTTIIPTPTVRHNG